ncbi:MAG: hypothetical protein KAG86_00315, partial [Gammaproteobacteria bacterium]|nr:hypothetical protein [Gammaproteobacteria bacterium]
MDENVAGSGGTATGTHTIRRKIIAKKDDAEEFREGSAKHKKTQYGSSDLELTIENGEKKFVGLRFRYIKIPQGATINSAYIQFQTDEVSTGATQQIQIYTERSDNAPQFERISENIANRDRTGGHINWLPPKWHTVGERGSAQKTPNLKNLVKKVIDRNGWSSGNSIVFLLKGKNNVNQNGKRVAEAYHPNNPSFAPELIIEYNGPEPEKTRLEVMQSALNTVLVNAPTHLNVGLMNYGEIQESDEQMGIKFPVKNIEDLAFPVVSESLPTDADGDISWWRSNIPEPSSTVVVRTYLSQITNWFWKDNWYIEAYDNEPASEMVHIGSTPIVEALYEAALYFRGEQLGWGHNASGFWESGRPASHPASYEGDAINWSDAICNDTWTEKKWGGVSEQNSHINFANNERDWMLCPSDKDNPSGIGSYANCASTEVCNSYPDCPSGHWVSGTGGCNGYSEPDEAGETHCISYNNGTSGYCDTDEVTKYRCKYQVCNGGLDAHPNYISPIEQSCQRNFIVLLSDGKPQYSRSWDDNGNRDGTNSKGPTYWRLEDNDWSGLEDKTESSTKFDHTSCADNLEPFGYASGACGSELTKFLSEQDQSPLDGLQAIDTYAIGFGLGAEANASSYLQSLVTTTD